MNIRKIIKEEIARLFEETQTAGSMATGSENQNAMDSTLTDISAVLQKDLDNVGAIIQKLETDSKNRKNDIKSKLQIKSKLPADNPDRKGLNVSIPVYQNDDKIRDEQLKNLKDTQIGIKAAQDKINKQKAETESQGQENTSVLPSLQSPI